jgi:hypothetical protein
VPGVFRRVPTGALHQLLDDARHVDTRQAPRLLFNAVVCSRVHELQEALSAAAIALEISSRNARVAAFQERRDRLRTGLDLVLDQRGADMADLRGGTSELLVRDYKGRNADRLVTRLAPGVVSLVAELPAMSGGRPRSWASGRSASRSR